MNSAEYMGLSNKTAVRTKSGAYKSSTPMHPALAAQVEAKTRAYRVY